ncbi:MAG: hypothetical protein HY217_04675 [Candidatus Rokubacteria bacterium]|nr:hypothetical protein [Candidatus Rokubacteria bacterium]
MKLLVALALLLGFAASPVLANECPTLQAQIDKAFRKRAGKMAASVKVLAREAWALHKAGKHDEAGTKYAEAAKKGGLELKHAQ